MVHVGLKIAVREEQGQVGFDAGGGDQAVDGFAHRDALAPQRAAVLRCCCGIPATDHGQQRQGTKQLPRGGNILFVAKALEDLHQDEIPDGDRCVAQQRIESVHLCAVHAIEEVDPDRGVDNDHRWAWA